MAKYNGNGTDWRAEHARTKQMIAERSKYLSMYTPFERLKVDQAIEQRLKQTRSAVIAGAEAEWKHALVLHEASRAVLNQARKKEAQRWDPARVTMEYQLARSAFDRAQDVKAARAEYDRAVQSGDIHKQRAFGEVFSTSLSKFPQDRLEGHRLSIDAQRLAERLQTTDEIVTAEAQLQEATRAIVELSIDLGQVAHEIDSFDLSRMIEKVHVRSRFDGDSGKFSYELEPEAVTA